MNLGVLARVDRGEMKAECLDAAQQSRDAKQAGMFAAMSAQACDDHTEVLLELGVALVAISSVAPCRHQPSRDQIEQHAVGHVMVACRNCRERLRESRAI